jgi:hypothetical protein
MSIGALRQGGQGRAGAPPLAARLRRPGLEWLIAGLVFALAAGGLALAHAAPRLALPRAAAVRALRNDAGVRSALHGARPGRIDVMAFDARLDYADVVVRGRVALTAEVARDGTVVGVSPQRPGRSGFGSDIANSPWVLALLAVAFALMTAVVPLRRRENADALLALAFSASVVLYDAQRPAAFMLLTYPLLALMAVRCAWRGLGPGSGGPPATPLFEALTAGLGATAQRRLLRLGLVAEGLVTAMVGLSSLHVVDVGYAVMEGATVLLHGTLPYGHIPDVLHGDTYPFGSYLLYVPLALLTPVHTVWDDADLTLALAVMAALAIAWVLRGRAGGRDAATERAGLRAAIAWLCFPAVLVTVSTGTTDVALAAVLLLAVLAWRRPAVASALLGFGAWLKLVPLALLPLLLAGGRPRSWARIALAFAAVSVPMLAVLLALGGIGGVGEMLSAFTFQSARESTFTPWRLTGAVPVQQLVQAAVIALVAGATARLWREPSLAGSRPRMAALAAAVLLGLQLAASYWDVLYLAWVAPLVALMLCARPQTGP